MAPSRSLLRLLLALLAASLASAAAPETSASLAVEDPVAFGWPSAVPCRGTVEQCLAAAGHGEFVAEELALGPNRRVLYDSQYIGYGALQADRIPCSRRGASYYNCRPGGEANPYSRGCSSITQCRG